MRAGFYMETGREGMLQAGKYDLSELESIIEQGFAALRKRLSSS